MDTRRILTLTAAETNRAYRQREHMRNPHHEAIRKLRQRLAVFGLTLESWERLCDAGCGICGTHTPGGRGGFHTDHDHATGNFRGPLCHHCNLLLGQARDNPDTLAAAIRYLAAHA